MAKLSPIGNDAQFINGIPAVGAKIFTYAAGSSTKLTTYTDDGGLTAQSNPIILNARGEPDNALWLTEGLSYKIVFASATDTDPPTSPIWDIDDVSGVNDATVSISQWVDSGVTPTYINATSFTLPGDQTTEFEINRRIKATVTAGTVYGRISNSVFGALTTVTVVLDSGTLDSGLSAVQLGLLTATKSSIPALITLTTLNATTVNATDVLVADEVYGAGWDGSLEVPTKNAIYDKIQTMPDGFASNAEYVTGTDTLKALNSAVARARNIVAGTTIATTSGTSHDFTGIPSWAKRITVMVSAVSVSGTASPTIQLGDAGGPENTGYIGAVSVVAAGSTAAANLSSGFQFSSTGAAAQTYQGTLTLTLLDPATNLWSCSGCIGRTDTAVGAFVGGSKALSATLDRIRLTTTNGTDTFDAGSINILYE
jgi:hypothetical protein